jgi:TetR/AcrR family transcriptional regulator
MQEANTENLILQAARKTFILKGKDGARMQEIADVAGVNKMLLHYYFRSKEKLFECVIEDIIEQLINSVVRISVRAERFEDFLKTFINRHIDFLKENQDTLYFALWEIRKDKSILNNIFMEKFQEMGGTPFDYLAEKIDAAVKSGEIRPVEPADFVLTLASLDVFPFIVLSPLAYLTDMNDKRIAELIDKRKKEVFRLLWNDIKT